MHSAFPLVFKTYLIVLYMSFECCVVPLSSTFDSSSTCIILYRLAIVAHACSILTTKPIRKCDYDASSCIYTLDFLFVWEKFGFGQFW